MDKYQMLCLVLRELIEISKITNFYGYIETPLGEMKPLWSRNKKLK